MIMTNQQQPQPLRERLPIAKNEDVEYDSKFAGPDDVEAVERAHAADARQQRT
ncbi:YfhD family protein [Paenibacillus xerothermodurans]|uniref:YfhD family protein n=1 Tax=Paenibacillus xerothermodurans TaxID=1977292 RepID=A0A2W1NHV1_PAEXE|nr:YfhD family protein [Paenibacillus xerothermodurans]PZE22721.1 YfhD family protein [Paenibacillus xerothermodurans]